LKRQMSKRRRIEGRRRREGGKEAGWKLIV